MVHPATGGYEPCRAVFGVPSFNFSKAPGIMRANMELSIAVGMRPPLFSWPCAPDIKNCAGQAVYLPVDLATAGRFLGSSRSLPR